MQHPLACGLALGILLLAGCAAAPSSPSQSSTPTGAMTGMASHSGHPMAPGHPMSMVLRNGLSAPVHKTLWANGTVAFQDTCNTGSCLVDSSHAFHTTDITGDLPAGAPVQVSLELAYQPAPTQGEAGSGFDTWVQSDKATFYSYNYNGESGHISIQAVLLPAGTVQVVMAAFGPGGGVPSTPYTLRIAIDADPTTVPSGVPVGVALGPGSSIAASAQGKPVPFLLYSPTDALLGKIPGNRTLDAAAPKGEYVVLLPPDAPPANLTTDSGDARMSILDLRFEAGPAGSLPPHGSYDASWDVAGTPLAVGLLASTAPSAAGPSPFASAGFTMRLTGPNGFALATPNLCEGCLNFGSNTFGWGTATGDEHLGPGSYAIHAETNATYELQVQPYAVYVQR